MISLEMKYPQLWRGQRSKRNHVRFIIIMMLMLLSGVACGAPRALPAVLLDAGSGQSSGGDGVPPAAPPAARRAPQGPVRSRVRDAEGGAARCARAAHTRVPRVHPGLRRSGQRLHSLPTLLRR